MESAIFQIISILSATHALKAQNIIAPRIAWGREMCGIKFALKGQHINIIYCVFFALQTISANNFHKNSKNIKLNLKTVNSRRTTRIQKTSN
jgi:hypothetical protein